MLDYVNWFRHSTPYINTHRDCTFVVLLPGEALADPNFVNIVHDIISPVSYTHLTLPTTPYV